MSDKPAAGTSPPHEPQADKPESEGSPPAPAEEASKPDEKFNPLAPPINIGAAS